MFNVPGESTALSRAAWSTSHEGNPAPLRAAGMGTVPEHEKKGCTDGYCINHLLRRMEG
jgi:hypothetical protein